MSRLRKEVLFRRHYRSQWIVNASFRMNGSEEERKGLREKMLNRRRMEKKSVSIN